MKYTLRRSQGVRPIGENHLENANLGQILQVNTHARRKLSVSCDRFLSTIARTTYSRAGALLSLAAPELSGVHSGDLLPVFKFTIAPTFEVTGSSPRGCSTPVGGHRTEATRILLDDKVVVILQRADTDLYFCFVGVEPRPSIH